jgi:hypothetical protein
LFPRLPNAALRGVAVVVFSLLTVAPAWADGVAPRDATRAQTAASEKELAAGKKLLSGGKAEEAIAHFRAAHEIVATPTATLMIARARRDNGEVVEAHAEYQKALGEAEDVARTDPKYEKTLATIRTELAELAGVLGKLVIKLVHAPQGTEITIDSEPVDASKLGAPMLVAPGTMAVVATAPDGQVAQRSASVNAGQTTTIELAFTRESEPQTFFDETATEPKQAQQNDSQSEASGGSNTLAYVAGGVGVAGLAAFATFGLMANSKFDDLEKACPNDQCPPDRQEDIDDGKQLQTFANVGLVVGIVGLGTGAALLVFGGGKNDDAKRPSAEVTFGYGSVRVRGSF